MGLPALLQRILGVDAEPVREIRINIVEGQLQVTSQIEVNDSLDEVITKNQRSVKKDIQGFLPECVNFGMLPCRKNDDNIRCSTLTLQVDMEHNSIDEINTLAKACEAAHTAVLDGLSQNIILKNIHDDLIPFSNGTREKNP